MAERAEELKHPDQEEIIKKLEHFQQEFTRYFQSKVKVVIEQADALIPVKEGVKLHLLTSGIDWIKESMSIVPVVGPFIGLGLKGVQQGVEKKNEKIQTDNAKNVAQQLLSILPNEINIIIHEVALELIRIYEYQIALLKDLHAVKKMAHEAVDCSISSFAHGGTESHRFPEDQVFDRNWILKGIIGVAKHYRFKKPKLNTCIPGLTWQVPDVFTKPGIWRPTNEYEILHIDTTSSRAEIYGYRGDVMEWKEGEYYPFPGLDDKAQRKSLVPNDKKEFYNFHQSYAKRVLHIIATRADIKNYSEYLLKEVSKDETPWNFNKYLAFQQKDRLDGFKLIAVYRGKALINCNLSRGVFNSSNFNGIRFKSVNLSNSSWHRSYLINVRMEDTDLSNSSLLKTSMQRSILEGDSTSLESATVDYANFSFARAAPDINFSNITNHKGTIFDYCNFDEIGNSSLDIRSLVEKALNVLLEESKLEGLEIQSKSQSVPVAKNVTVQDNGRLIAKDITTAYYLSSTANALNKLDKNALKAVTLPPKNELPPALKPEEQRVIIEGGVIRDNAKVNAIRIVTPFTLELNDDSSEEHQSASTLGMVAPQK